LPNGFVVPAKFCPAFPRFSVKNMSHIFVIASYIRILCVRTSYASP
jgi:hypothetical protein